MEGNDLGQYIFPEGGVGFWRQTQLLIAKNWKCKLRTAKKKLAGEIFLPVFYLFLLSIIVQTQPNSKYPALEKPDSYTTNILSGLRITLTSGEVNINVVPDSTEAKEICELVDHIWNQKDMAPPKLNFSYYATYDELQTAYSANNDHANDLAIVFSEIIVNNRFNYTIMWDPSGSFSPPDTSQKSTGLETCRSNPEESRTLELPKSCPVNGYYYSGFLGLQYLLDQALLTLSTGNRSGHATNIPAINIQNYPKLAFNAGMSLFLRAIIPLYSVIPMAQLINNLLVLIVTEKEERIKDGFRMIGVSDGAYWLSWFMVYSVIVGILSVLFTLVMHLTSVLRNINILLLFLIFFLFGLSVITFAFALTPFFHKPKTAGVVGTLIMQFCGMLFMLQTFVKTSTDSFLVPLRLISSLAFTTALDEACAWEYSGGISFSDLVPGRRGERILYSLVFICFDIVFYGLIAVYLDNVIPNEYGARKHPLFCFMSSFWRRNTTSGYRRSSLSDGDTDNSRETNNDPNIEKVPTSLFGKEAIRIRNVHKTYTSLFGSTKVEAIKGISLNIYDGQITAILGKNGAGKSTLFSIITGLVPPSSGKSIVFGMDTSDPGDLDRLRKITGVCLQSNLHFPSLTVEEHLELYGKLRGLTGELLDNEIHSILEDLKLNEKRKTRAVHLSGGQQRKLSVGVALIGDPKIILLDEPSAGVDPVSRRHLWHLLKRKREGRVILLTTHFLDEADFLADRKAIIHNGVLKCHGSSLFLKNRFGVGYHLTIETEGPYNADQCDLLLEKWVPHALGSKKVLGNEIKYCLPHSDVHLFASLFGDLESLVEKPNSPFKSYGVSMTTLEEVFLKISTDAWEEKQNHSGSATNNINDGNHISMGEEYSLIPELSELKISVLASLWVLCLLRVRRLIRSPQSLFFMLLMPSVLVAIGLVLMKTQVLSTKSELLAFNNPGSIYKSGDELRVAVSENSTQRPEFDSFLQSKQVNPLEYSGIYSDLLNHDLVDPGTMAAVALSNVTTSLLINGTYLHSLPLLVSMHSQYYWQAASNVSISANAKSFTAKQTAFDPSTFYAVFLIGPSFTFPAIGMVMELVKDRELRARNHLRVNGVSFGLYFCSVFIVFGLLSVFVTLLQIGLILIFALPAFMNLYAMIVTTALLLLFIPSCLLFSTIFSYMFDRLESAQSIFSPISSWMGTLVGIIIIVMDASSGLKVSSNVLLAHGIFSALDVFYIPFAVFYWINKLYIMCSLTNTCDELSFGDYMGPEFIIMAICLVVQVPIFALLVVVADVVKNEGSAKAAIFSLFKRKANGLSNRVTHLQNDTIVDESHDDETLDTDTDVVNEKLRVAEIFNRNDDDVVVAVQNLRKTFRPDVSIKDRCRNKKVEGYTALKGVNFAVEQGEVFGLLGHNGAGKSTLLRIVTAEEGADSGNVRLCGTDIQSSYSDAFLKLGYCAQHDPLWENISLKEHLELYAVVRGIPKDKRERLINHFLVGLQIEEHANKKAAQLSGGTKRKLSYGMSMLGAPKIVLLDEPSTGMDPQSKRFLWNTVQKFSHLGFVLTTHSMEEAEVLSTRIGILVKGSLICIGSPQHLKSKYGTGYTLEIKLKPEENRESSAEERYSFVQEHFPGSKTTEMFDDKAVFSLTTSSVQSISRTFSLLEELKQRYDIEEYSFSQTTLEQVFLLFAKENDEDV